MFFFLHISFRIFGQTVALTSPMWAFLSSNINVRDWATPPPACVRLVRKGDTLTGSVFLNGKWEQEGQSTTVPITDPVYIGLAVTSHVAGTLTTATFDRACTFSAAELHVDGIVNFKDFAVLADMWLEELLWP